MKILIPLVALIVASSHAFGARPEPEVQIAEFFRTLGDKGGTAAVDGLCKGTLLAAQKGASELVAAAPQLDAVVKVYGKIARTETIEKKPFGQSFVRIRAICYHANGAPTFWEFLFFKAKDEWQIYTFQFNDQFSMAFPSA